ncbi:hypothetical protein [Massilia horti]|uniref:Uncharacterized protein n=1 Tax=Massilia horti TaxID=2562153 RepID=A0A4Y9T156_9BURK|nr:hypothetical protein [Massilia horti]TFW33154.1 hypothetical protein E4O92_07795 [Massilia horti]
MKLARRFIFFVLFSLISLAVFQRASAQTDPRLVLAEMIRQSQTGTMNPYWYGPQLWQTIASQTGNTGIYPQLVQLGPVQNIFVTQQLQLPQGQLFAMTVQHLKGQSKWIFGISNFSNRIEYANFNVSQTAAPPPLPAPFPSPTPIPAPGPGTSPGSSTPPSSTEPKDSEACKKFPNLC